MLLSLYLGHGIPERLKRPVCTQHNTDIILDIIVSSADLGYEIPVQVLTSLQSGPVRDGMSVVMINTSTRTDVVVPRNHCAAAPYSATRLF